MLYCIKINKGEVSLGNKRIRQEGGLSPVVFSLFMNDSILERTAAHMDDILLPIKLKLIHVAHNRIKYA